MFRKRRLAANPRISLDALASEAGVKYLTLQKIETGKTQNPGILTVVKIDQALCRLESARETAPVVQENSALADAVAYFQSKGR